MRESAGTAIGDVYDKGTEMIGDTKNFGRAADVLKKGKKGNLSKLTQMSGLGLKYTRCRKHQ